MLPRSHTVSALSWRHGAPSPTTRDVPEEIPVVLTYDHVSFAVMMASPSDLHDFAYGFSFSEGIIKTISDITACEIVELESGIECRITLIPARRDALALRRRNIAGPAGCGLCGLDSLTQATRPLPRVTSSLQVTAQQIADGITRMSSLQILNQATRAVHAAAYLDFKRNEFHLREDIGRHNALDKALGAALQNANTPENAAIFMTSRVSIELIQKAAIFGAPILAAISVPSARAIREAESAGITLIAIARNDGYEIFTHPDRITTTCSRMRASAPSKRAT